MADSKHTRPARVTPKNVDGGWCDCESLRAKLAEQVAAGVRLAELLALARTERDEQREVNRQLADRLAACSACLGRAAERKAAPSTPLSLSPEDRQSE